MNRVVVLGVPLDPVTRDEAVLFLRAAMASSSQCHVATPNNEMLVEAHKNAAFRAVLNRTALNLPDSTGLLWAVRRTGQRLPERVTGVDTVTSLCAVLDEASPVFLLGAAPGIAEKAAHALQSQNPRLRIAGTFAGSPREEDADDIIARINRSGAKLLLVAYGAPAQDLWIAQHLPALFGVRVAIGIGGTFDFLAGTKKRAPAFLRRLGLEWLYRFIQEPSRYKRMWNAVVIFPWLVLTRATSQRG